LTAKVLVVLTLLLATLPMATRAATFGPEEFGYTAIDSDEPGGPVFAWIDPALHPFLPIGDDEEIAVAAPFPITFFGVSREDLLVGNNGGIIFGITEGEVPGGNFALASSGIARFIAPFWDDLDDSSGSVRAGTVGAEPNRQFVVTWLDRPHFDDIGAASFQVVFTEGSSDIVFQYLDVDFGDAMFDGGASATVGIRGASAAQTITILDQTPGLTASYAVRFEAPTVLRPRFNTSSKVAESKVSRFGKLNQYTLNIVNSGSGASTTTLVLDPIPTGASYVDGSVSTTGGPPAVFNGGLNRIEWGPNTVAAVSEVEVTYFVVYNLPGPVTVQNAATLTDESDGSYLLMESVDVIDPCASAGTDSLGYHCLDSYSSGGPSFSWVDATGGTALGLNDEDEATVLTPFPVFFHGAWSSTLRVGNNGAILFNQSGGSVFFENSNLETFAEAKIAPFWDDLGSLGDAFTMTTGTAPDRRFVISWVGVNRFGLMEALDFQVIFIEGEDDFIFQYRDATTINGHPTNLGGSASVGITGGGGISETVQYSFNQPWLENNLAIRFIRPGVPTSIGDWMIFAE
jgi:uncharacterized repeat protein (TIGR01451 family)